MAYDMLYKLLGYIITLSQTPWFYRCCFGLFLFFSSGFVRVLLRFIGFVCDAWSLQRSRICMQGMLFREYYCFIFFTFARMLLLYSFFSTGG